MTAIFVIAGCASTPKPEEVKVITQQVDVPVPVACKEETPVAPIYCFPTLDVNASIYDKTKCMLSDRYKSIGYETELLAKFNACK